MSSMEAEYIAAAEAAMEAVWIHKFISRLGIVPALIDLWISIQEGDIRILKVHTDDNLADPFTKPMPCTKHVEHSRSI
ncbi:hypothetical protein Tco_0578946 [Tanacetum coccineum]